MNVVTARTSASRVVRLTSLIGLLVFGATHFTPAVAYTDPESQYKTNLTQAQTIDPIGSFGEQISLRAGTLSFRNVDFELPGTGPTIRIVRTAQLEDGYGSRTSSGNAVAGWEFEIPRIKTITADPLPVIHSRPLNATSPIGWQVAAADKNSRCTNFGAPADVTYSQSTVEFRASEWWFGQQLVDDNGNEQPLLIRSSEVAAQQYRIGTSENWVVACLPTTANGEPGEAFLAVAPDGTKYWFNYLTYNGYEDLIQVFDNMPPKGLSLNYSMPRRSASMLVTRIEDRFGNWVNYSYSGPKLASIAASDGRSVTFSWQGDSVAVTVGTSPNTRVWNYGPGNGYSMQVTQPDGSYWGYAGQFWMPLTSPYEFAGCSQGTVFPVTGSRQVSVRAPSGATAAFQLDRRFFGRSYVPKYCGKTPNIYEGDPGFALIPKLWIGYAMTSKSVSGPGLPTQSWNYTYSAHNASWQENCPAPNSCARTVWTQVTAPDGDRTVSHFSNVWDQTENKLLKEETYAANNSLLRTVDYTYATTPSNAANPYSWPLKIGTFANFNGNDEVTLRWTPLKKRTITQQGVSFDWQANTFDPWARTASVTRSSTLGNSRTDITTYYDHLSLWVIGQPASSINADTGWVESQTDYGSNALPLKTYAFGKLQQTFFYNVDGTLGTVKDGNNHMTAFADWKRGIPQTITFADTTFKSAHVDDFGGIDWVRDENGYKTCYAYDAMGRLTGITYPSETQIDVCDTSAWNATAMSFAPSAASAYGLPAGHWRQTTHTGNAYAVTYFDALWRPVVKETYDIANTSATLAQTVTRYDAAGQVTYASYPQRSQTPAVYNTWADPSLVPNALGSWTAYDALGRTTQVQQNSELGPLTTTYAYLTGFQTRVTNPRGYQTTTSYTAYDQPRTDWPQLIAHPEGATTTIARDVFGKPATLSRRNADASLSAGRYYAYDQFQRLCKQTELETGTTAFGYDEAGNLAWSAAALPWSPSAPCQYTANDIYVSPRRVDRTYDARNRLKTLVFPDGQGDQVWNYMADGQPAQVTAYNDPGHTGAVITAYLYNARRQLSGQGESISQPNWYSWGIGYAYDRNGNLASHAYPSGLTVTYAPNALGQPTQVGSYAGAVSYYPNGAIQQFTYGNGLTHTLTQNARQLPATSCDFFGSCGASAALNDGYSYDPNGNVASISDGRTGQRGNRSMGYDGLDRLTSVVSTAFGNANYSYDVLDNLTRTTIGGTAARDHYYCYDAQWRLTNVKTGGCGGASVIGLGYDERGNLANKNGLPYLFDVGNRLRLVDGVEYYRYDGLGRRVHASHPTLGIIFSQYTRQGQLFYQHNGRTQLSTEYLYLGGSLVATRDQPFSPGAAVVKYQHTDALGSPIAVTDQNRNVIEQSEYEPNGKLLNRPLKDGPGFTGHVSDALTGMSYMQQRYYDPMLGRFLSMDPVTVDSVGGNFNRYWYANNNPYKFKDPDGRFAEYVLGQLVDPNVNTIVTDGNGGIKPHLGNTDGMGRVVLEGVTRHEGSHIADFYIDCENSCNIIQGAAEGLQVRVVGQEVGAASEVNASNVELNYLDSEKDRGRNRSEKPAIETRVNQMTQYRDANQAIVNQANTQPPPPPPPPPPEDRERLK